MARAAAKSSAGEAGVVGKSAHVRGRVSGQGDLRVEGTIEGELALEGELLVAEGGQVTADVEATTVVVEGSVEGSLRAADAVVVRSGARVAGDLTASRLTIEEGALYTGRIELEFELPAELGGKSGR